MWVSLAETDVIAKLSGPEIAAMKTAALQSGQANPLTEILGQVTREVRGYVKACASNQLGSGATIPDELEGAAVARVRFELATRLPVSSLLTEDRKEANRQAVRLLEQVAACKFTLEQPATVSTEESAGSGVEIANRPTRQTTRAKLSGL